MDLKFKEEMMPVANLQLLIQIKAMQETQLQMLCEFHGKDEEDINTNIAWMNTLLQKNINLIMQDLFTKYGEMNIKELFDL